MAGGTQCTVPEEKRWALVMWVTTNSPSALRRGEALGGAWGTPAAQPRLLQITTSRGTPITQLDHAGLLGLEQARLFSTQAARAT